MRGSASDRTNVPAVVEREPESIWTMIVSQCKVDMGTAFGVAYESETWTC